MRLHAREKGQKTVTEKVTVTKPPRHPGPPQSGAPHNRGGGLNNHAPQAGDLPGVPRLVGRLRLSEQVPPSPAAPP